MHRTSDPTTLTSPPSQSENALNSHLSLAGPQLSPISASSPDTSSSHATRDTDHTPQTPPPHLANAAAPPSTADRGPNRAPTAASQRVVSDIVHSGPARRCARANCRLRRSVRGGCRVSVDRCGGLWVGAGFGGGSGGVASSVAISGLGFVSWTSGGGWSRWV